MLPGSAGGNIWVETGKEGGQESWQGLGSQVSEALSVVEPL